MFEQSYSFHFEAAHELGANVKNTPDHPYSHIHGHSFHVTVTLAADAVGEKGWVMDFAELKAACEDVRSKLDHRFLNHIEGLERPTLENLARYIFGILSASLSDLATVDVARPSLQERVRYSPRAKR
ncbi:MAG: 6-carboxytetrahydropterin synthase QueD [Pseudomonadota bacterium]